jgi:hypothetical protein
MGPKRVAVIAVHGVADQEPGVTLRAVADLLVSSPPPGVRWEGVGSEDLALPVAPLAPRENRQRPDVDAAHPDERSWLRALAQSGRSDFQRAGWQAPRRLKAALTRRRGAAAREERDVDRGIAATNYLLTKHRDNRAEVSVYEMYWADLSRLSGTVPRIVSEIFTMVFRLSKLGRETVDEAWGRATRERQGTGPAARVYAAAWACTGGLQIAMDWLFVNVLSLLFMQLGLMAVMLVTLGLAGQLAPDALHGLVAAALGLGGVLRLAWLRRDGTPRQTVEAVAAIALGACALAWSAFAPWLTGVALLAAVSLVNEGFLRVADERFPFVHTAGRWLWIATTAVLLCDVVNELAFPPAGLDWRQAWMHAVLFTTEVNLLAIKLWWIVAGALLMVWFAAGLVAGREGGYVSRGSIATGRMGVAISFGMFLAVTMSLWALLNTTLLASVEGVGYSPCIFVLADRHPERDTYPANACLFSTRAADAAVAYPNPTGVPSAARALRDRYLRSTTAFSTITALLVVLIAYAVTMFTPSVLAELKLLAERAHVAARRAVERRSPTRLAEHSEALRALHARRLGRWLTTGLRHIDAAVLVVTMLGAVAGLAVALIFIDSMVPGSPAHALVRAIERPASHSAQFLLKPMIFSAATAGAALWLAGGFLSRTLPPLRAPLDVALDVDNHFREFPRSNIARAHIFARFSALLAHVAAQRPDRIVIVAHSQGTVISAELLRFLASDGEHAPADGDRPIVGGHVLPPVSLLTLGCPLRQLYAARFPCLYGWVLARNGDTFGPMAADIGAERWMNGFCSGDYVGRWLWSGATVETTLGHPADVALGSHGFGRPDVYGGFQPDPPLEDLLAPAREVEVCLGLGAHTHYLEAEQAGVSWMIDWLVRADPVEPEDEAALPVAVSVAA